MRTIPDDNLAYPVLINLENSSGSGFQLDSGTHIYFITAKHVLFQEDGQLRSSNATVICQTKDLNDDIGIELEIDLKQLNASKNVFSHPKKDVAAFTFGAKVSNPSGSGYIVNPVPGVIIKRKGQGDLVWVESKSILLLKDVLVSNDIFLYGYPSSLGLRQSPQFNYSKPLLRKGIIASVNKTEGTLILDCAVYPGNSGGPVVQVTPSGIQNFHRTVGVISQFIPYAENWINPANSLVHSVWSNSGYSVAVAMDYVFEMLSIKIP